MKHALAFALVLSLVACKKKEETPAAPPAPASATAAPAAASAAPPAPTPAPAADQAAPPATGDGIQIPASTYKVGDTETKTQAMKMKMVVAIKPDQPLVIDITKDEVQTREALAVDASGNLTKVKLAYKELKETESMGGKTKDKPSPTAGKTYIAWAEGGDIKVTLEDGSAPSAAEIDEVADDQKHLGMTDPMDEIISSKRWKTGEKVTFTPDELAKVNNRRGSGKHDNQKLSSMELALAGVAGEIATFDMVMGMDITSDKGTIQMKLSGQVKVFAATGRLDSMNGTGPIVGNLGVPVSGEVTLTSSTK
jgi:hypothetical protein